MFSFQAPGSVSNTQNNSFTATGKRTILFTEEGCWAMGVKSAMPSRKWADTHLIQYTEIGKTREKVDRTTNCTSCCAGFTVVAGTDGVEVDCLG